LTDKNYETPIADMIAEMMKNCIPIETIMTAVRSLERAMSTRQKVDASTRHPVDDAADRRRAWDREYRRRKRGRPPDPPDIHPTSADIPPDKVESALSFLKEDKKHSGVVSKKEKGARGSKIPPDWRPKELHYEMGAKLGMNRRQVDERADEMRSWCDANSNRAITTKANWDAAFTGAWLKRGQSNGQRFNGSQQRSPNSDFLAGMRSVAEDIVGDSEPPWHADEEVPRGRIEIDG